MAKNQIKNLIKLIFISIVSVVAMAGLLFFLAYYFAPQWLVSQIFALNGNLISLPNSTPIPIPEDWKTYTNAEEGIQMRYPATWSFWEQSDELTYHVDFAGPQGGIIRADFDCSYVIGGTESERSKIKIDRQQFGQNVFVRHRLFADTGPNGESELVVHAYTTPYPDSYIKSGKFGNCRLLTFIIRRPLTDENVLPMMFSSLKFIGLENSGDVFLWDTYFNSDFGFSMDFPYDWKAFDTANYSVIADRPADFPQSEKIFAGRKEPVFFISMRHGQVPDYSERLPNFREVGYFYNTSDKEGLLLTDGNTLLFLVELPDGNYMLVRAFSDKESLLRQAVKSVAIPEFDIRSREF